jgi:hypothetical protein
MSLNRVNWQQTTVLPPNESIGEINSCALGAYVLPGTVRN